MLTASRFGLNLLIAVANVAIVVLGVWIAGGVVDDFRAAMGLTAAWFGLAGVASLVVARSERSLRLPVVGEGARDPHAERPRVLTLTHFETAAGPDLRVRILPGDRSDGAADDAVDLGALKGNRGNQQYALPRDLRRGRHTIVIWCRAFSALFGAAWLRPS